MKLTDLEAIARGLAPVLRNELRHRDAKLAAIEARLDALEARPQLRWDGVWREQKLYPAGRLVTRSGSLWLATEDTARQPGDAESGWRLIVKQGRVEV